MIQRIVLAIMGVICLNMAANAQELDFRQTRWGMSAAEVKTSETSAPSLEKEGRLAYTATVLNREMIALYLFVQDKLVQGAYTLAQPHANPDEYIRDFDDFKHALTKKYGKPIQDDVLWKHYKDPEEYEEGWAVSVGRLQLQAAWETETTMIYCIVSGGDNKSELNLFYRTKDPELKALVEEEQKKTAKRPNKEQEKKDNGAKQEKENENSGL